MFSFFLFLIGYGLLLNAVTWLAFWHDKRRATQGGRRVPEKTLLTLAALGGSPAADHARRTLRHKTQKQPFCSRLAAIRRWQRIVLGLAVIAALLWFGQTALT